MHHRDKQEELFTIPEHSVFIKICLCVSKIGIHTASKINVNQASRDSIFINNNAKDNQ